VLSFTIPRTEHLASQGLPAAGAWVDQAFATLEPGTTQLTYWITYRRGSATGFPLLRPQWGNDTEEADELILDESSFAATPPTGRVSVYQMRLAGPVPADNNPITYALVLDVPYGSTKARLNVSEGGDIANPGNITVAYTGGTGAP
jgi:hypothetical protein